MLTEPANVLYRLKRGLSGYVSYLAACEMNEAFTGYGLYEPILPCPGLENEVGQRGDVKRIDFDVGGHKLRFAIEVKWARTNQIDVKRDYMKLRSYRECVEGSRAFLCVFGRMSHIEHITLKNGSFSAIGKTVFAEFGVTRFGCRMYELDEA